MVALMPEVSVVVPIYNVERYLGPCIESLRRQTHRDLEVILVDDGSNDGSTAIARQAAADDPRIHLVRQPNRGPGPGGGRNGGLAAANGKFLMFVDGDDVVPPTAIEMLRASIGSNQAISLATGGVQRIHGARLLPSRLHDRSHLRAKISSLSDSPELVFDPSAWNKLFRRTHFDTVVGAFPEQVLYEDMVATMAAFSQAEQIAVLEEPVYWWRVRQAGSSITQDQQNWRSQFDRFSELERLIRLLQDENLPTVRRWLDWKIIAIDLAYTHQLLDSLPEADAHELFHATNTFLERAGITTPIPLSNGFSRLHDALRSGDFDTYAATRKHIRAPIRPDRNPISVGALTGPRGESQAFASQVLRVASRGDSLLLDLRMPPGVTDAVLCGSSPVPLEGGTAVWRVTLQRKGRGWARAQLPTTVTTQHLGETHLEVRGSLGGEPVRGEIERSDWDRAFSLLSRSPTTHCGTVGTSTFYEDGQLHLWSSSPDSAIASCTVSEQGIELRVSSSQRTPEWLRLSALRSDIELDVRVTSALDRDGPSLIAHVPHSTLRAGVTYALATLDDPDDPMPLPIEVRTASTGRCSAGWMTTTTTYVLRVGERGQALLQVGAPASIGAARRAFDTRRSR